MPTSAGPRSWCPGASAWKPGAVAVGVVALYLLVAVQATSLAMRRLPRRWWRWVHLSSYAMTWSVTVHAGLAGTDATNRVYQAVALVLTIGGVTAGLVRVLLGRHAASARRSTAATGVEEPPLVGPVPVGTSGAASPAGDR